jgi:hypothetical protein
MGRHPEYQSADKFKFVQRTPVWARGFKILPVSELKRNFFSICFGLTEPRGARFSLAPDVIAF